MFSTRVSIDLAPNRLAQALQRMRLAGRPIIDLTESNPTRAGFQYPADLLEPLADPRALVYDPKPFGSVEAREAVAADYARRGTRMPADRIVLTASTSEAYSILFKLLISPGDEILVPRPSYPLLEHLAALDAAAFGCYELEYHDGWAIDLDALGKRFTPQTRAIVAVSPNNPTGHLLTPGEVAQVAALCAPREVALIVDEVFVDYLFDPGGFNRAGDALTSRDVLTFSLGGMSKSIGLPQVKLGWIGVGGPEHLVEEALARLELVSDTYLSVSTPVQVAAAAFFERGASVRAQITDRIRANYARLRDLIASVPSCRVLRGDGGWSAVLQVPTLRSEEDLVLDLLDLDGVLVHPGYFFDFPRESYLIVSLLVPEPAFVTGIERVLRRATTPTAARERGPS